MSLLSATHNEVNNTSTKEYRTTNTYPNYGICAKAIASFASLCPCAFSKSPYKHQQA
jgi:hypothetical protein